MKNMNRHISIALLCLTSIQCGAFAQTRPLPRPRAPIAATLPSVNIYRCDIAGTAVGPALSIRPTSTSQDVVGFRVRFAAVVSNAPTLAPGQTITYQWTVGGSTIKTYEHDIDEPSATNTTALAAADLTRRSIHFYWTRPSTSNSLTVRVTIPGHPVITKTVRLRVRNSDDPNRSVYANPAHTSRLNDLPRAPNSNTGFNMLTGHGDWHATDPVDEVEAPTASTTDDVPAPPFSTRANGSIAFGDNHPTGFNGRSFLKWHEAFIGSYNSWRAIFAAPAIPTTVPSVAPPVPAFLLVDPTLVRPWPTSTHGTRPDYYVATWTNSAGQVRTRLTDFPNLYELGEAMTQAGADFQEWHGHGHTQIATLPGMGDMGFISTSPATRNLMFYRWHGEGVDKIRREWVRVTGRTE